MQIKFWKIALPCGLFLLVIIAISLYSQLELPKPTGPYMVGRMTVHWMDLSRPEVMTDNPDDSREIMAFIWYPAEPGTGVDAGYFPEISTLSDALAQSGELTWWQAKALHYVRSKSPFYARPLKEQEPYPVILFHLGTAQMSNSILLWQVRLPVMVTSWWVSTILTMCLLLSCPMGKSHLTINLSGPWMLRHTRPIPGKG